MKKLIYLENEGALFRGINRGHPTEVWHPHEQRWAPYTGRVWKPVEWGHEITKHEAERLMGVDAHLERRPYPECPS